MIGSINRQVTENFYAALDDMLAKGAVMGADLLVSADGGFPLEMHLIAPGAPFPAGRAWTMYHTSSANEDALAVARRHLFGTAIERKL